MFGRQHCLTYIWLLLQWKYWDYWNISWLLLAIITTENETAMPQMPSHFYIVKEADAAVVAASIFATFLIYFLPPSLKIMTKVLSSLLEKEAQGLSVVDLDTFTAVGIFQQLCQIGWMKPHHNRCDQRGRSWANPACTSGYSTAQPTFWLMSSCRKIKWMK